MNKQEAGYEAIQRISLHIQRESIKGNCVVFTPDYLKKLTKQIYEERNEKARSCKKRG